MATDFLQKQPPFALSLVYVEYYTLPALPCSNNQQTAAKGISKDQQGLEGNGYKKRPEYGILAKKSESNVLRTQFTKQR